jgi:hypothetical protein
MHYGPYAFSKNGLKTIEPKVSQLLHLFWYQFVGSQAAFVVLQTTHKINQNTK